MKLFEELQRRNVIRAAISYLVAAWLILQVVAIVFPMMDIAMGVQRIIFVVLAIGFPCWLVFAYLYNWTPDGFKRTGPAEQEAAQPAAKKSNKAIIFGLSLAVILLVVDKVFDLSGRMMSTDNVVQTIAVLPFSHESPDGSAEFFTSGIHADIMTKLVGIHDFRLIAKSSVMPYANYEGDISEIGRRLNARYVMEGTVRRLNDDVRITTHLVDAETNQAVWTHTYDGNLSDVFALQSSIATDIADQLRTNLSKSERADINAVPTNNVAAYDMFLKAQFILDQPRTALEDLERATGFLEEAVDHDPEFYQAWAMLVKSNSQQYERLQRAAGNEVAAKAALERADEALEKAKYLAPENWQVLREEGYYLFNIKQNLPKAALAFEKVIERNPSEINARIELSKIYMVQTEVESAIAVLEEAFALVQTNGLVSYFLSFAYEFNGDFDKMVPLLERLAELYPEQKHYLVEAAYYQFLHDGSLESFAEFRKRVQTSDAENPWDERAIQNMEMVVAMFDGQFDTYHENWKGKHQSHIADHGDWMCPLVANDHLNEARMLMQANEDEEAHALLHEVSEIVLKPINPNSVCIFNPEVYLPKLDLLKGDTVLAKLHFDEMAAEALSNDLFPLGAVERSVLVQAADLIYPEKVYQYYELAVKNALSISSFESICADPWTYPNLIKDPRFVAEIKADGRFVAFLQKFGFIEG